MTGSLQLQCRKCTKMAVFRGPSKEATAHMAIEAGWRMLKITKGTDVRHEFICPTCPKPADTPNAVKREDVQCPTKTPS